MRQFWLMIFIFFGVLGMAQATPNDTIKPDFRPSDSIPAAKTVQPEQILKDIEETHKGVSVKKPLFNPTKAGLYSAVLPGLGQYYNKKYWKIPVAYAAIGTGVGFILYNQKQYKRYRDAFVAELNGQPHEFSGIKITDLKGALGRQQDLAKRQRDYAIGITAIIYILNIVDAVVDAHLYEGRHDPDLAFRPTVIENQWGSAGISPGLSLSYSF